MSNEEEFKRKIQEITDSKEFIFQESDWESARDYIAARRKRRRAAWLIFPGILILCTSLATWLVLAPAASPVALIKPAPQAVNSSVPVEETTQSSSIPANINELPAGIKTTKKLESRDADKTAGQQKSSPAITKQGPDNQIVPHTVEPEPTVENHAAAAPTPQAKQQTRKPETGNVIKESAIKSVPAVMQESPDEFNPTIPGKDDNLTSELAVNEVMQETEATPTPPVEQEITAADSSNLVTEAVAEHISDTKSPDSAASAISDPPLPGVQEFIFTLEGGAAYLAGWKYPGTRDGNGFNPVFGINYFNYITEQFAMSFGGQYNRVNNLNYSSFSSAVTRYGLGEESAVTIITPLRLHYVGIPLRLHYMPDDKNTFGIGYNISYLLNVEARVEKYKTAMGARTDETTYITAGYTEGFKIFDSQLSVFYGRKIYNNISLKTELFFGLSDVKDNVFFGSNITERNAGVRMTLVYGILRKQTQ